MAKYNIFEEFMNALHFSTVVDGKLFKSFFPNFESLSKVKVGNKFVTHFDVPKTNGGFEDRKVIDLVQDSEGNLLGLRTELYDKYGKKICVDKITPNVKSVTYYRNNGVRKHKVYDNVQIIAGEPHLEYNYSGINPVRYN